MTIADLESIANIIQAVVTSLGILSAGIWTLYNFGLTRISAARIDIAIGVKTISQTENQRIAIFAVDIKNTGKTKVAKKRIVLVLRPLSVASEVPPLLKINKPINYYEGDIHEILKYHTFADPNEGYHEEVGFIVTNISLVQVGVLFEGAKQSEKWEANYLFDVSPKPAKAG
jgi:hypothetical protein